MYSSLLQWQGASSHSLGDWPGAMLLPEHLHLCYYGLSNCSSKHVGVVEEQREQWWACSLIYRIQHILVLIGWLSLCNLSIIITPESSRGWSSFELNNKMSVFCLFDSGSKSSDRPHLQPAGGGGWNNLGQYLFPLPLASAEGLPQFLLPACGGRAPGLC